MKFRAIKVSIVGLILVSMLSTVAFASTSIHNFSKQKDYSTGSFTDVSSSAWYANDVQTVYELGLMGGKGKGKFDPNGNLLVAEAISMVARVHNIYNGGTGDIPASGPNWYDGAVAYCLENGIITSSDFSSYTSKITRAQMAYLFANALPVWEYQEINNIKILPDVACTEKYFDSIFRLYNAGIVGGSDTKGTFKPDSYIIRAEAAAIIKRVVDPTTRKLVKLDTSTLAEPNYSTEALNSMTDVEQKRFIQYINAYYDLKKVYAENRDDSTSVHEALSNSELRGYGATGVREDNWGSATNKSQTPQDGLINTIFGKHTYGAVNQKQYDMVMDRVAEAYANRKLDTKTWLRIQDYKAGVADERVTRWVEQTFPKAIRDLPDEDLIYILQVLNAEGNLTSSAKGISGNGESLYDYLFNEGADCNGTAYAESAMWDYAGFNTKILYNNSHAWAEVQINGLWYNCDGGLGASGYSVARGTLIKATW